MSRPYRALVVGCGRIGSRFDEFITSSVESHAGAYVNNPKVELAGLCDQDLARATQAAAYWNVGHVFQDAASALEAVRPAIVSVCTPDATHSEILHRVLECESVRAILAEKPLTLTSAEAKSLATLARDRGVIIVVNYTRRFHGAYRNAYGHLQRGRIGDIRAVTGYYSRGIKHNGTHWIDLARWYVGEISAVRADHAVIEYHEDPTPDVRLEFESGALGQLKGIDQRYYALFEMDLLGTEGRLRITQGHRFTWSSRRPSSSHPEFIYLHEEPASTNNYDSAIIAAVDNLLDCLEGKSAPLCSAEDAIRALQVAEACVRSLETSRVEKAIKYNAD